MGSYFSLHTAEIKALYFVFNCFAEDLFKLISNKFRMVCKVDGNLQLDSRDWSMCSSILKTIASKEICVILHLVLMLFLILVNTCWSYWSVAPRRPSDQSDAIVAGFLYMFVSIFLSLVVGFRARFHSSHLALSEGSCLKRQPTLRCPMATLECAKRFQASFLLIAKRNGCALHLENPRKTNTSSSRCFCSFLKF